MKQSKEVWHDSFYLVCNEYLIAIQLNLVALQVDIVLDSWEVENTCEVEWIVYIEVNPEQWFILHRVEGAVETLVVFIFERTWSLCPQRFYVVYHVVFLCFYLLTILPFCLFAKGYRYRQELAIFVQQSFYASFFQELLAVVVDIKDYIRTSVCLLCLFEFKFRTTIAAPLHGCSTFFIALSNYFHLLANHESRVEAKAEVTDNRVRCILIFLEEVVYS